MTKKPKTTKDDQTLFGAAQQPEGSTGPAGAGETSPAQPTSPQPAQDDGEPAGKPSDGTQAAQKPAQDAPAKPGRKEKGAKPGRALAVAREPQAPAKGDPSGPSAIMGALLAAATNPDVNPEKMERMLAMVKELQADDRKRRYDEAMAQMQPNLPIVDRNGRIIVREKDKHTQERTGKIQQNTPYAKWEDIAEAITPVLGEYGFAQTFRVEEGAGGMVIVTCIVSHEAGHREQTTLKLPHDASGSKNPVQAIGSSISYGKRYTSSLLLNFVTRGEDDDGKAGGGRPKIVGEAITAEDLDTLIEFADANECPRSALVKHLNSVKPDDHPDMDDLRDLPKSRLKEATEAISSYAANKKARDAEKAKQPKGGEARP